jgi:hypothetical protein
MTEDFLHFVWKFKLPGQNCHTAVGEVLHLLKPGDHNHDAGPDFINAQVKIGDTLWAGNIEIHIRSSDWKRHRHQFDEAYDNIILHVVFEDDLPVRRKSGELIPTLVLKDILHPGMYETYNYFLNNHLWIPCAFRLPEVKSLVVSDWLTALSVARLERKATELEGILEYSGGDWNQAFYESLAGTLGFKINKLPFEQMARQTPLQCIEKNKDQLFQVESILFGQAGLLDGLYRDEYPKLLKKEYLHQKNKFSLKPVSGHLWKFLRLRPNNFPTVRLAQLAMILHERAHLFSEIIENPEYKHLNGLFSVGVSDYWKDHYYFDRPSKVMSKKISSLTAELIMINNVVPFLFLYGKMKGKQVFCDKAVNLLESLSPESNSVTRKFTEFGIEPDSASQSQGLLELKANFCDLKKCLECRIGVELLK